MGWGTQAVLGNGVGSSRQGSLGRRGRFQAGKLVPSVPPLSPMKKQAGLGSPQTVDLEGKQ